MIPDGLIGRHTLYKCSRLSTDDERPSIRANFLSSVEEKTKKKNFNLK